MKKILSVLMILVIAATMLTACSVSLTDEQKETCEEMDATLSELAEVVESSKTTSEIKKVDGKLIYFGTIDYGMEISDNIAKTFGDYVMPLFEKELHDVDLYVVLNLNQKGEEVYRLVDSALDPSILD